MAQQGRGGVDLVEVDVREGAVEELDIVPVSVPALDLLSEHDLDVLGLPVAKVDSRRVRRRRGVVRGPNSHRRIPPARHARALHL